MNIDTEVIRQLRGHLLAHGNYRRSSDAEPTAQSIRAAVTSRVDPFAETMYLVMIADGEPAEIERRALVAAVEILTEGILTSADIELMFERYRANASRGGAEARFAQLGSWICVDREDREIAFSLGAAVALADETVDVQENQALKWIRQYYGVSEQRSASILGSV